MNCRENAETSREFVFCFAKVGELLRNKRFKGWKKLRALTPIARTLVRLLPLGKRQVLDYESAGRTRNSRSLHYATLRSG